MIQKIKSPVSVSLLFNHQNRVVCPTNLYWEGKNYRINQVGLHHTYRTGRTLYHVFSVVADGNFFRLVFDTDTLHWTLEGISDGLPG